MFIFTPEERPSSSAALGNCCFLFLCILKDVNALIGPGKRFQLRLPVRRPLSRSQQPLVIGDPLFLFVAPCH